MSMKHTPHGFTLIETMVAITILTLSIVGPLITADRSIVAAETARDQLTASYLAQEGIEYVRGVRDNAYLSDQSGGAWNDFLSGSLSSCRTGTCTLGPFAKGANDTMFLCPANTSTAGCAPFSLGTNLTYTNVNGHLVVTSGTSQGTPFTRTIQLTDVNGNEERVTCTVSWVFHSTTYSVTINDHLTSWQ